MPAYLTATEKEESSSDARWEAAPGKEERGPEEQSNNSGVEEQTDFCCQGGYVFILLANFKFWHQHMTLHRITSILKVVIILAIIICLHQNNLRSCMYFKSGKKWYVMQTIIFYERYRHNERALTCSVNRDNRLNIPTLKSQIRQVNCKDVYVTYASSATA